MPQTPRVSVFIPVHNRADYIRVAVDSILAQDFEDFELIVVDDGSTDATPDVLAAYEDRRLRVARHDTNLGIPAARNRGLELARGEYLALLDSDDHAYPQRLGRQVAWLDAHPDIVQIGSWCSFMDADGRLMNKVRRQPLRPDDLRAHLLFHCPVINRTVMARTAVLKDLRYNPEFPRCQDFDMHARLIEQGHRIANLPELLVCGREHPGRFTGKTEGLGRERKMAVFARLLGQIGIDADARDLACHYALARPKQAPDAPEVFLDWAESWLWRIKQANRSTGFFPEPSLSRVLGAIWALNCWHARRALGRRAALARLAGSALVRGVPGNFDARFLMHAFRRAQVPQGVSMSAGGTSGAKSNES
ncbi:MAG: glycosyltransferase family A protein [Wenzhouxiangellaceae bacterium]|nr:glycosyltransferase family A protein [Wenzhouxiangellaceae bacterium]